MSFIEFLKILILGIIEGITEWLPISSTGHMIIVDEWIKLDASQAFKEMFFVVIQLGAIMAVVINFFQKLNPFTSNKSKTEQKATWVLWLKIIIASLPAAVFGFFFDDWLNDHLYNYITVALMLIFYGIGFIIIEKVRKNQQPKVISMTQLSFKLALAIGFFQVLALIPGTSRSGATILGAMILGASRLVAAEFSFFLSIPVMFGASLLKVGKYFYAGNVLTSIEVVTLLLGMSIAFVVSIIAINFLLKYIKNKDFQIFGWYRIFLGAVVILYFWMS